MASARKNKIKSTPFFDHGCTCSTSCRRIRKGRLPLLLWHGGGLTGVTYETKPDGGDGWLTYFIRKGWDTYISDAVERGRSGWTSTFKGEAVALPRATHGSAFASVRPVRGTTTRASARPIRAHSFRSRPTINS